MARTFRLVMAVYGMVYTLLLPIAFGIVVRAVVYPVASLEFKNGALASANQRQRPCATRRRARHGEHFAIK